MAFRPQRKHQGAGNWAELAGGTSVHSPWLCRGFRGSGGLACRLPPAVSCFAGACGVQRTQGAAPAPRWSLARESPWLNPPGQRAVLPCPVFRRSLRNSTWCMAIASSLCGLGPFVTQQQATETPGWRGCRPTKGGQHADGGGGVSWPQSGSPPHGVLPERKARAPLCYPPWALAAPRGAYVSPLYTPEIALLRSGQLSYLWRFNSYFAQPRCRRS